MSKEAKPSAIRIAVHPAVTTQETKDLPEVKEERVTVAARMSTCKFDFLFC